MRIVTICLLQSESSVDSCEDPKTSKQSQIEEETGGYRSSDSEDMLDCGSIAFTDSDHAATHSHGVTGGRGATCGCATTCSHGIVTGGHGRGCDQNPLGQQKKEEPSSLCFNYGLTPGPQIHFRNNITPLELFCKYFLDEVWDLLVTETNRYAGS